MAVCVQKLQRKHWKRPAVRNRRRCSAGGGWPPPPSHYVFVNKCVNRAKEIALEGSKGWIKALGEEKCNREPKVELPLLCHAPG